LGAFKEAHPNVEIRLNVNYGVVDFVRDEISVAIRIDKIPPPKEAIVEHLIREQIGPVCAPDYVTRHAITRPEALASARLLVSATRPSAWQDWWTAIGHRARYLEPHETYEHFYLQNQAAACGLGVAMTPRILVEDQLAAGRLIAPFGFAPGPYNLVLWIAPHLRLRSDLRALVAWLKSDLQKMVDTAEAGIRPRRPQSGQHELDATIFERRRRALGKHGVHDN
jgi:DNA-binding transcriptional LysR family regulator